MARLRYLPWTALGRRLGCCRQVHTWQLFQGPQVLSCLWPLSLLFSEGIKAYPLPTFLGVDDCVRIMTSDLYDQTRILRKPWQGGGLEGLLGACVSHQSPKEVTPGPERAQLFIQGPADGPPLRPGQALREQWPRRSPVLATHWRPWRT